ncbi:MAG: hypothetical protein WA667_13045 [Candidatus Nitrosopolaris sp.]
MKVIIHHIAINAKRIFMTSTKKCFNKLNYNCADYEGNRISCMTDLPMSRFAVLEIKSYTFEEFKQITLEVLHDNPLAEYIADRIWTSSNQPNIRDCVRI